MDDLVEDGTVMDGADVSTETRQWKAVLADSAKVAKVDHYAAEDIRFERWFRARFANQEDVAISAMGPEPFMNCVPNTRSQREE